MNSTHEQRTDDNTLASETSSDAKPKTKSSILSYILTIVITAGIMFVVLTFVGRLVCVNGDSMKPTYENGQILLIEEMSKSFDRFDIVTIRTNKNLIIKRVIGCPGETVQIKDGKVFINDEVLNDIVDVNIDNAGNAECPITLKDNQYFVLGDIRNKSIDSRSDGVGIVTGNQIFGRVIFTLIH
jgi:signal peptidase I